MFDCFKLAGKWIVSLTRWFVSAVIVILSKLLAMILAPIAALPFFIETDENGREEMGKYFYWATTHDAPIDIYAFGTEGRKHWLLKRYNVVDPKDNPQWLRYINRLLWIWRNPAYVMAQALGYDQTGMKIHTVQDEDVLWDTGVPNFSFWWATNAEGQIGWMLEWQWYFYKKRCLEVYLGWKLHRDDPDKVCMLVSRITPFKSYG